MEEKDLYSFAGLLQEIPALAVDQLNAMLSVCRELVCLPPDAVRWVCDATKLIQDSDITRGLLRDLFQLIDHKVQGQRSFRLTRDVLTNLVSTISFHHKRSYHFACEGELARFLSGINEAVALEYYCTSVVGAVCDKLGRRINIWKNGRRHLYKDKAHGHTIAPEFFQETRAKRLPWIRHVLINSTEIYEEPGRGRFGKPNLVYVGQTILGVDKPKYSQYFLVFVESNRSQKLALVTAFHVDRRKDFLRLLAGWRPRVGNTAEPTPT